MRTPQRHTPDKAAWPKRGGVDTNNPGEPLYTLGQVCAKGGLNEMSVRQLLAHHPGLNPWMHHQSTRHTGAKNYYRLSDFKSWWRGLPAESKAKAKLKNAGTGNA